MRPEILFPLFAPITSLPRLGEKIAKRVAALAGPHVADLLWHLPTGIVDRRFAPRIAEAPAGRVATITARVDAHVPPLVPRRPYRVRLIDETGILELTFFHGQAAWLEKQLPLGAKVVVSGMVERFNDQPKMVHPDVILPADEADRAATVEAVHPLTDGVTARQMRGFVAAALERAPALPDWLDPTLKDRRGWPDWRDALAAAQSPGSEAELSPETPARMRLAYDELLANQLALSLVRRAQRDLRGRAVVGDGRMAAKVTGALPFALTGAQARALEEIRADQASESRMLRLLQGDVGSGKTVVALLAMLNAVEAGHQAALMAPTEILARQHLETIQPLADAAGIEVAVLTGREKGKAWAAVLDRLATGTLAMVIGTHALFQEEVAFADLALAVVDEQHKFGVHQRLQLSGKGRAVDVLVMTATPIPRTLTLTAYGDMDVSRLDAKPPGRRPVQTVTVSSERLGEVVEAVARKVREGERVYWVCPLVDESEQVDLAAATERHAHLKERLGSRVGLVHGRMKGLDKDAVMAAFAAGDLDVLVATTVIEVGVNVPAATVMVVEHAERFGLAQLHQLRGRVGRGDRPSSCLLVFEPPLAETARARLAILRETEDGFRIAEEDLKLRGAGDVLGTRQSGLPAFRLADLAVHGDLLAMARDDARLVLARDPDLADPRGKALRVLLYLFERDAAVRYLRSG
ncbi:MAG: ATP-dependent DNA helicase RecG [Rhodospirillales bacterium]